MSGNIYAKAQSKISSPTSEQVVKPLNSKPPINILHNNMKKNIH